ncbi:MAG TPA: aminopeptidase P family N-terminal domain-containing protein, partial [Actinomycetota bacterium]
MVTIGVDRARGRMARAAGEAAARGFDALIVAPSPDLVYLTGYAPMPLERPTLLVLVQDHAPVLVVPELERLLASEAPGAPAVDLVGWPDGMDPYATTAGLLPDRGRVAVGDRLWASHLLALQAAAPGVEFRSGAEVLGRVRSVKDPDEIDALRRAGAAADRTFEDVCALPFAGRREREVADDLARLLVEHGHERADFTIVASGPNAASPHHEPGDRVIDA